jgi:hypothetical protein
VFAGFPTTTTLQSLLAHLLRAVPYSLKIDPLTFNKSFRSIPGPLGRAPTKQAT